MAYSEPVNFLRLRSLALGLALAALSATAVAQTAVRRISFQPTSAGATAGELRTVAPTPDGNFVIGGVFYFGASATNRRGYVAKINPAGTTLWSRLIIGDASGPGVQVEKVKVLGDGSVVTTCIGQSLTGIRFNGTTGNVIRSTRRPGVVKASDVGPDGSMYFDGNALSNVVNLDEYDIDGNNVIGSTQTRTISMRKVDLNGVETVQSKAYQERNLIIVSTVDGSLSFDMERTIGHRSKFLFDQAFVALYVVSEIEISKNGQLNRAKQVSYYFRRPSTGVFTEHFDLLSIDNDIIDLFNTGFNPQGKFAHNYRQSQGGFIQVRQESLGREETGSFNNETITNISEKVVQVGGFTHRSMENHFLRTEPTGFWAESKFNAGLTSVWDINGSAFARDSKAVLATALDSETTDMLYDRRNVADASAIDTFITVSPMGKHAALVLDTGNRGISCLVGNLVVSGSNRPVVDIIEFSPILKSDTLATTANTPVNGNVLTNDIHAAGGVIALHTPPTSGSVSAFNPNGAFTYTPATGFTGTASFTYRVTKPGLPPKVATVTIIVS